MPKDRKYSEVVAEEVIEEVAAPKSQRKFGKVLLILKNRIIIEYDNGLGTEIPYNEKYHFSIKVGDKIEIP